MNSGCLVQITASSITGGWGNAAQRIATWLLERNAVHVIASDAHDDKYRKPILSEARDAVSKGFGAEFAQALVLENPAAIIAGLPLPSSREPSRDTSQKFHSLAPSSLESDAVGERASIFSNPPGQGMPYGCRFTMAG